MTQLVAALCENRTKVVLVSDRMITTSDGTLAFEHEPKYEQVSNRAIVLMAGTVHEPEFIEDARLETERTASVRQIAENLAEGYRCVRKKRIEHEVLQRYGIPSFEDFYNKQRLLHEDTNLQFLEAIKDYDLEVDLVLGGVDNKAHIYHIAEPGTCISYDELGFCCVGSGDRHAEPVFAFYGFRPSLPVSHALQIAHEAKKRSEMAGGVGRETDVWIIDKEGCHEITDETTEELRKYHEDQETVSRLFDPIEIKTRKLKYPTNQARTS